MRSFSTHPLSTLFHTAAVLAVVLLISAGVRAQETYHPQDEGVFARLSYDTSAVVSEDDAVRHLCVTVLSDGEYRIERTLHTGTERLQGKLTKEQLEQLKTLLDSEKLRAVASNHSGLIRQDSESFAAEIQRGEDGAQRLRWLNADDESPFPASIAKVVDWLKRFEAKDAQAFEYAEYPDVCPASGLRRIQPSVAQNGKP
jgi:hypothetical protein